MTAGRRPGPRGLEAVLHDPERLASLAATGLLTPDIDGALDEVAELTRDVLEVPVVLATLVEGDRQCFVGLSGLRGPWAEDRQTPLTHSFCQYVVADAAPLVITDAREHPVLRTNLAIPELDVVAYAGWPITDGAGRVLGSLCAIDSEPREWTDTQLRRLERLAAVAAREVVSHTVARDLAITVTETDQLIDTALEGIVTADLEGRIVGWNRHAEELFGWSLAEVLGRGIHEVVVPEEHRDRCREGLLRAATGGGSTLLGHRMRLPARHRDGHQLLVELTLTAIEGPRGLRFHGFLHDVTAEAAAADQLAQERAFLRGLLDALDTGVVACDAGGTVTLFNRAVRQMHGLPAEFSLTRPWERRYDLYRGDGGALRPEESPLARASAGEAVRDVEVVVHHDGRAPRSFLTHAQPIVDETGRTLGAVAALHDITDRKEHERQREELLRTQQAQVEELRHLHCLKDQLFGLVTHELRNPITAIRGYAELLLHDPQPLPERHGTMVGRIDRAADRMLRIVNDLLDIERVGSGEVALDRRPLDLGALVQEAVESAEPLARAASLELSRQVDGGPFLVEGDGLRLRQVLDNLLGNAVKYTPAGGRIEVAVARDPAAGVTLTVADTGIGIPEEERGRLFERFFRASTAVRSGIRGTGLGLAVTRTIVEAHGGTITAAPRDGGGTVFTVRLPG